MFLPNILLKLLFLALPSLCQLPLQPTCALDSQISCEFPLFLTESQTCSKTCPLLGNPKTRSCTTVCPLGFSPDYLNRLCTCSDATNRFFDPLTNTCVSKCSGSSHYADPFTNLCTKWPCSQGFFADPLSGMCVSSCQKPTFIDSQDKLMCTCADGFFDSVKKACANLCTNNLHFYNFATGTCLAQCSNGWYGEGGLCKTACQVDGHFTDPSNNLCSIDCPLTYFKDMKDKKCVQKCPNFFFLAPTLGACFDQCATGTFANPQTNLCEAVCPVGFVKNETTGFCFCSNGFYNFATSLCGTLCPQNFYGNPLNGLCESKCTSNLFGDPSTKKCVEECPEGYFKDLELKVCSLCCRKSLFQDLATKTCTSKCSPGYFPDLLTQSCVNACSDAPLIGNQNSNNTNLVCNKPQYYQSINSCIANQCLDGYYKIIFSNKELVLTPFYDLSALQNGMNEILECLSLIKITTNNYEELKKNFEESASSNQMVIKRCIELAPSISNSISYRMFKTCISNCTKFYNTTSTAQNSTFINFTKSDVDTCYTNYCQISGFISSNLKSLQFCMTEKMIQAIPNYSYDAYFIDPNFLPHFFQAYTSCNVNMKIGLSLTEYEEFWCRAQCQMEPRSNFEFTSIQNGCQTNYRKAMINSTNQLNTKTSSCGNKTNWCLDNPVCQFAAQSYISCVYSESFANPFPTPYNSTVQSCFTTIKNIFLQSESIKDGLLRLEKSQQVGYSIYQSIIEESGVGSLTFNNNFRAFLGCLALETDNTTDSSCLGNSTLYEQFKYHSLLNNALVNCTTMYAVIFSKIIFLFIFSLIFY